MKSLTSLLLTLSVLIIGFMASAFPLHVQAQSKDAVCAGINAQNGGSTNCDPIASGNSVNKLVGVAIRIFQAIVGVIALFMFILAGLSYITSGGDSSKTKTAKDRILYGSIGLAVVALAQVIIQFVLNRLN